MATPLKQPLQQPGDRPPDRTNSGGDVHLVGASRTSLSAPEVLVRRWWIVLLGAVVIALLTYGVSKVIPPTYSSSAIASVLTGGTDANDTTQGEDNLASQYAQLVDSATVLAAASQEIHASVPTTAVSGGTVNDQNLISIVATADSATQARARASAVAEAFVRYLNAQSLNEATDFGSQYVRQVVSIITPAAVGTQTVPKPTLYAIVAFILGLLIVGRLVVYFSSREV
jgi:capsular polysaccharide biosynthesis protein